nr:DUF6177 family protein [Kibdelosporangium phytohabitans]
MTGHPAADRETPAALVVEQDRTVVPLSTWLADAAVTAVRSNRVLQILTPARSSITYPLELLITDGNAQWVVRDGVEKFHDGMTGAVLTWNGSRFTGSDEVVPATPGQGSLEVQITTLHRPNGNVQLGLTTEAVTHALTGALPYGWGTAEPATEPWSPREITRHCHTRTPDPTALVVVGKDALGSLEVRRVDTGVRERLRLAGPSSSTVAQSAIEALAAEVAGKARSMIVASHPGRQGGLRSHSASLPSLPYGILIGHDMVAQQGVAHASAAPARVRILEPGACWCRLDSESKAPYEVLTDVLRHFGLREA